MRGRLAVSSVAHPLMLSPEPGEKRDSELLHLKVA
jgi:hypothetical protein